MKPTSVKEFFRRLPDQFDAEAAEGLTAVYQFDLTGPQGGHYQLVIEEAVCSVEEGEHHNPHVTFSMSAEDCLGILAGRLDGYSVFLSGRVRVSGDLGLAMQLKSLFPTVH